MPFLHAARALARRKLFTLVTLATLSAGIGVTTAAFSMIDCIVLRPLPFPNADRLVAIYEASPGKRDRASLMAPVRMAEWGQLSRSLAGISGSYAENVTDTSGSEPERLQGRRVMPGFFDVFGMAPLAGRTFVADEERFGGAHAAVISESLWIRRFNRDAAAIGSRLRVEGAAYTIVGVIPRAFTSAATDVWIPAQLAPGILSARQARFVTGVARLKPGVSIADARADLARVQSALGEQYPATDRGWSADLRDLKEVRLGDAGRPIVLLFAAIGVLFAVAVANVAGLVLAQLHRRTREFAVRAAIGASRRQIVAAVLREIALIAASSAVIGVTLSSWLLRLAAAAFTDLPRMNEIAIDARAVAFALIGTAAAAVVFGVAPAVAATRGSVASLVAGGRTVAGGRHRLQRGAVAVQLALGVALAGTAGLLVRSYDALTKTNPGFESAGVLTFHAGAAWGEDRGRVAQFQARLLAALQQLPGVRAAGYANFLPESGATLRYQVRVQGLTSGEPGGAFTVGQRTISAAYPDALRVPLLEGQWCRDTTAAPGAPELRDALVNRSFAERFAAGQTLVGRPLTMVQGNAPFRIAAVVGDVREDAPGAEPVPYVYTCVGHGAWPDPEYVVSATGDARPLAAAIREAVKSIDPARPVFGMRRLDDVLAGALDQPRLNAAALGSFATAALLLAALGLYGLMTLLVGERRRELGVRMALGASPRDLLATVLSGAGPLVAGGVVAGLGLTLVAGRLMRALLFGVQPFDPLSIATALLALVAVSGAALVVPMRRAATVNAIDAMRGE